MSAFKNIHECTISYATKGFSINYHYSNSVDEYCGVCVWLIWSHEIHNVSFYPAALPLHNVSNTKAWGISIFESYVRWITTVYLLSKTGPAGLMLEPNVFI